MTNFVGIISAKGGVGKTTTTINLSSALHFFKRNVIALDANFANPDLGIHLGVSVVEKNLHGALLGKHDIKESVYRHSSGLLLIPGSISYADSKETKRENLLELIYGLVGTAEVVIIDSTPGLGRDAKTVIRVCDQLIIVTTPDLVSVTGSLRMIKLAQEEDRRILGVIINKYRNEDYELSEENIAEFLHAKILGVIPHDPLICRTLYTKSPLVLSDPNIPSSIAYKKVAGQLIGEKYIEKIEEKEKKSGFSNLLKNLGFKRFK